MSAAGRTLGRVVAALDGAGVEHMIVGSFASAFHGEPRTTQDIDLVVRTGAEQLDRFVSLLSATAWYVDRDAAHDAWKLRSMFNVIDLDTGWKVDVIVLKSGAFAQEEFGRRIQAEMLGTQVFVATAEDTLLAKLSWAKAGGGSERQLQDVAGVLAASGEALDRPYIERWAHELGVDDLWRQACGD